MSRNIIEIIKQNASLDKTIKHVINKKYSIQWNADIGEWSVINYLGFGLFNSLDFDECKSVILTDLND